MLTGLGLRNFKAFGGELQDLPLSKITLIYGPNSGGKSSILQSLLLLKQSIRIPEDYPTFYKQLAPNGDYVKLDSSRSMVYNHDEKRRIDIRVKYRRDLPDHSVQNETTMTFSVSGVSPELTSVHYRILSPDNETPLLEAELNPQKIWSFKLKGIRSSQNLNEAIDRFLPFLSLGVLDNIRREVLNRKSAEREEHSLSQGPEYLRPSDEDDWASNSTERAMWSEFFWGLRRSESMGTGIEEDELHSVSQFGRRQSDYESAWELENSYDFQQAVQNYYREGDRDFMGDIAREAELGEALEEKGLSVKEISALTPEIIPEEFERYLRQITYLGPIRSSPERFYTPSDDTSGGSTGIEGEHAANLLYRDEKLQNEANRWFGEFGIPYELKILETGAAPIASELITVALYFVDEHRNRIKDDTHNDIAVTIADVGYGVNQLLPVIVEGVASPEHSIVCVEQPELHLHPELQAKFAELMLDTIRNSRHKRKQWIVETHSEMIIRRIQRRIREGKDGLVPGDVSVIYVDPYDDEFEGSAIKVLPMNSRGRFTRPWPRGFFGEAFDELFPEED